MEYRQSVETIISELNEEPVGPVNFAQLQKRDQETSKGLRPKWNDEDPKDYSIATDTSLDVDGALHKATTGRVDPDQATQAIVDDVLRRLSGGDDFRKTDNTEHAENHDEDEPSEGIEFSDAFQEFCSRSR